MPKKLITHLQKIDVEELLKRLNEYDARLSQNDKLSDTKYRAMAQAIYSCKMIVREMAQMPQKKEFSKRL